LKERTEPNADVLLVTMGSTSLYVGHDNVVSQLVSERTVHSKLTDFALEHHVLSALEINALSPPKPIIAISTRPSRHLAQFSKTCRWL